MKKDKIFIALWFFYIVFYAWVLVIPGVWENSWKFYFKVTISALMLLGVIGYVAKIKIAYVFFWKMLFFIVLISFVLGLIMAVYFEPSALLSLVSFLPALYALYFYVYRSQNIWNR